MVVLEDAVRPPWPSEAPRSAGPGGLLRIRGDVVSRAMPSGAVAHAAWRGGGGLLRAGGAAAQGAGGAPARVGLLLAPRGHPAPVPPPVARRPPPRRGPA